MQTVPALFYVAVALHDRRRSHLFVPLQVLLAWVLSNGALVAAILSTSAGTASAQNVYMAFLLYSVAVLAAVRFLGCTAYSVMWLFQVRSLSPSCPSPLGRSRLTSPLSALLQN